MNNRRLAILQKLKNGPQVINSRVFNAKDFRVLKHYVVKHSDSRGIYYLSKSGENYLQIRGL
jgi:hypothetical protein